MRAFLSLGAGVQSSAMLLMSLKGVFGEMPEAAVFADTGWEPKSVYAYLEWLEREVSPFPIHRVSIGNLREDLLLAARTGGRASSIPAFLKTDSKGEGRLWRQCTQDYKIAPLRRKLKELSEGERIGLWLGISLDEAHRMKPSGVGWLLHRFPLVERRLTRADCLNWLAKESYPTPPKSACLGCPFHSDLYWKRLKRTSPKEWAATCETDQQLRHLPKVQGEVFLHRSLRPLRDVDLLEDQGDLFGEECEGMCGV